jgi:hypothetical protein
VLWDAGKVFEKKDLYKLKPSGQWPLYLSLRVGFLCMELSFRYENSYLSLCSPFQCKRRRKWRLWKITTKCSRVGGSMTDTTGNTRSSGNEIPSPATDPSKLYNSIDGGSMKAQFGWKGLNQVAKDLDSNEAQFGWKGLKLLRPWLIRKYIVSKWSFKALQLEWWGFEFESRWELNLAEKVSSCLDFDWLEKTSTGWRSRQQVILQSAATRLIRVWEPWLGWKGPQEVEFVEGKLEHFVVVIQANSPILWGCLPLYLRWASNEVENNGTSKRLRSRAIRQSLCPEELSYCSCFRYIIYWKKGWTEGNSVFIVHTRPLL